MNGHVSYPFLENGSSSHIRSEDDNVKKYVGIPNHSLTIANTSFKNCFQYACVVLNELMN